MALNQDKYDIEVRNGDAIKRNQILFDFMPRTFNLMDGLYLHEKCLLIDTIMKDQSRNQVVAETKRLNKEKNYKKKGRYI